MLVGNTDQLQVWNGDFGREYTDRNSYDPTGLDNLYRRNYGISRTQINGQFLAEIPRSASILEIGCNIGTQLVILQQMGFTDLHGIEVQSYALEKAKARLPRVDLRLGSALAIPHDANEFDLVFTSGVLIHIAPIDLKAVLREIHRCSRRWIWGFEYYAPDITEVFYRGHEKLLWKADYAQLYMQEFGDLELVREERLPYLENNNVDSVFLLQKR